MVSVTDIVSPGFVAGVLIFSGLINLFWTITGYQRDENESSLLYDIISLIGMLTGIGTLIFGIIVGLFGNYYGFTIGLLFVLGFALFLKILKNFPWASLLSLIIAVIVTFYLASYVPSGTGYGKWAIVGLFLFICSLLYMFLKFVEDLFRAIGTILSWFPIALIISGTAVVEGIMVFYGTSIYPH